MYFNLMGISGLPYANPIELSIFENQIHDYLKLLVWRFNPSLVCSLLVA